MPTFNEYVLHLENLHKLGRPEILELILESEGNVDVSHSGLHNETLGHTHNPDGTVLLQNRVVLDKNITLTKDGWSLDATPQVALLELNALINNRKVILSVRNQKDGSNKIHGKMQTRFSSVEAVADNFVDVIKLLIGSSYIEVEERNTNGNV